FGTCILEAMAMEKPVVVSDDGGLREILRDRIDGYVVPAGDPRSLAQRLTTLLSDSETSRRLGRAARERVQRALTAESTAGKISDIFDQTLNVRSSTSVDFVAGASIAPER